MTIVHPTRTLAKAIEEFLVVQRIYKRYPLQVWQRFQKALAWLPERDGSVALELVNAQFAKRVRDKAGREIGWRLANHLVVLLKDVVDREIGLGFLSKDRVRNVTLLRPPRAPGSCRRRLPDARHPTPSGPHIDRYLVIVRDDKNW
jgi:hypothetical protein